MNLPFRKLRPGQAALLIFVGVSVGCAVSSVLFSRHVSRLDVPVNGGESGDRIIADGVTINGKPVRVCVDTGSEWVLVLYRPAAESLGLKSSPPPADEQTGDGKVSVGWTNQKVAVQIGAKRAMAKLPVADASSNADFDVDGILGWEQLQDSFFTLDAVSGRLIGAGNGHAPEPAAEWQSLPLRNKSDTLVVEIPGEKGQPGAIEIDTGSKDGVELAPAQWREWRAAHPTAPTTILAYTRLLPLGMVVREVAWAEKLTLGPLTLTNVTVQESDGISAVAPGYVATLGLAALRRQTVVVDGKKGTAYFARQPIPAKPFPHNRLGALFVPGNGPNDPLVAHVAAGSPADEAGIRNGDVLMKINGAEASYQDWSEPRFSAGTKLALMLRRGDTEFEVTATLRDILGPNAAKAGTKAETR